MVCEIPCSVDRGTVTSPEDILLFETFVRKIEPQFSVFVTFLHPSHPIEKAFRIPVPDKVALPDKPIMPGREERQGNLEAFETFGDCIPEQYLCLGIPLLNLLHQEVDLRYDPWISFYFTICRNINASDMMVPFLPILSCSIKV